MPDDRRGRLIGSVSDDAKDLYAIQKTLQGDTDAFTEIVERYTPLLYSLALRILGTSDGAEDAVQEIFLNVYKSLKSFRINARFYSWLYTIAVNLLRSRLRHQRRIGRLRAVSLNDDATPELPDRREDPQLTIVRCNEEARAEEALASLKPIYRIVFVLRYIENMPIGDIAEVLKTPVGTIKARIHRAKKTLIDILTDEGRTK